MLDAGRCCRRRRVRDGDGKVGSLDCAQVEREQPTPEARLRVAQIVVYESVCDGRRVRATLTLVRQH